MKIKFLRNTDAIELERQVNDFIKDKAVADIKHSMMEMVIESYPSGAPKTVNIIDSCMIMYHEKSKEGEIDEES